MRNYIEFAEKKLFKAIGTPTMSHDVDISNEGDDDENLNLELTSVLFDLDNTDITTDFKTFYTEFFKLLNIEFYEIGDDETCFCADTDEINITVSKNYNDNDIRILLSVSDNIYSKTDIENEIVKMSETLAKIYHEHSKLISNAIYKIKINNDLFDRSLDEFYNHYIVAALWSSVAYGHETEKEFGDQFDTSFESLDFDESDLSEETRKQMKDDCKSFLKENYNDIEHYDQAGHDFWLTRCGHGVGFWDRDLGDIGDRLTKSCEKFTNIDLYLGDNGQIYS